MPMPVNQAQGAPFSGMENPKASARIALVSYGTASVSRN
jgi:hypothetical protein